MLHGWGMNSAVWSGFADQLAMHYRLSLIDLPGHGDSPYSGEKGLASWSRACLSVAPERAVWLGWSLGGEVTMQAALEEPGRVAGVIGLAATPRFAQARDWPHAMVEDTLEQFIQASRKDHIKTLERFLALQVRGSDEAREGLRLLKQRMRMKPAPQAEALDAGLDLLQTVDLRQLLRRLSCPTGWLYGERDTLVPAAVAQWLSNWLPEAHVEVIPGAAHAPFLSHPTETYRRVSSMLEWFDAD